MASHGNPFVKIHQRLIKHEEAASGDVFRELLRVVGSMDVNEALKGIDPGPGVEARLKSAQPQDPGGHEARLAGTGVRALLPALPGRLAAGQHHSGGFSASVLFRNFVQAPRRAEGILLAGEGLFAPGKGERFDERIAMPVLENFLAKNGNEDMFRSFQTLSFKAR